MNSLLELTQCGQSIWIDNLTRDKITTGELKKRIEQDGLRGVTSNPAIFNKAISGSKAYDEQIKALAKEGRSREEIYEAIVIMDLQGACDVLMPVYEQTKGVDGYVSLEVSPYLAHDTEGTMAEARRLYKEVGRKNCLIKIPGTKEGIPAIEQMLIEGININVTLLFSVQVYEEVAKAYRRAVAKRDQEGKPLDSMASVASFFLSRIDVMVDELLEHRRSSHKKEVDHLLGKIAVSNAKLAYQSFLKLFSEDKFGDLLKKGARVQRPLWASTSTKNPHYSDVMYVEPLIGEHTVNTLPDETIDAFRDHGKVKRDSVLDGIDEAKAYLQELKELDIDIEFVTAQLVNEGIQKFIQPYDTLLKTIEEKMKS